MASEKRCHYEVLGLSRDCTADEIRSAYKKLALQRHPDKLVQSGLSQPEATAQFQELAQAYEVLSDPKERAWYDSHRSQILFSDPNSASNSVPHSAVPNLFSFFSTTAFSGYSDSGKGFYKVYSDVFNKIYANEINYVKKLGLGLDLVREAPVMGNLESPYAQVTAFYNYWLGFCTAMDFFWVDQYDVMAGPNRKSRRVMEEENKKLRKKAKREYNETVRGLAEFVKKRDKRVIDMTVKKNMEMERKREEERERKKKLERERLERARAYEEPEWARIEEEVDNGVEELEEEDEKKKRHEGKELYCVACGKKFKSDKQWKNHEQSKKHKERVAELRESFAYEEEEEEESENLEELGGDVVDDNVEELAEKFREGLGVEEDENNDGAAQSSDGHGEDGFLDAEDGDQIERADEGIASEDDEEIQVLEAMMSGRRSRKNVVRKEEAEISSTGIHVKKESDDLDPMEYDVRKSRRRNRGAKKERSKKNGGADMKGDNYEARDANEETSGNENSNTESSSNAFVERENNREKDDCLGNSRRSSNKTAHKKEVTKKETNTKSKNTSKGKKGKATSKNSSNMCETCGEDFESRNKLHKHLGDTGHAALKFMR